MMRYSELPLWRRLRKRACAVTDEGVLRAVIAALVCTVGALTFVASYSGIYGLGNEYGLSGAAAVLLPLSADGLIMTASLVLLHEALCGRAAPSLARVMLWLGTTATATADIAYPARYGLVGAVISAWPMVAFPATMETVIQLVRRSRTRRAMATEPAATASGAEASALPAVPATRRDAELIAEGIRIREQAEREGVVLSGKAFAGRVREHGYTIANGRISWLRAACGFPSSNS